MGFGSFATQRYACARGASWAGSRSRASCASPTRTGRAAWCPPMPRPRPTRPGRPPASSRSRWRPGRPATAVRALDAAYAFATRSGPSPSAPRTSAPTGYIGAAENLGRQTELNNNQFGVDVRWKRPLWNGGDAAGARRFLRNEMGDLLEVYPSGYQLSGDFGTLIFGEPGGQGGVFEQLSFNSRRFDLGASLERDLEGGHKLTGGDRPPPRVHLRSRGQRQPRPAHAHAGGVRERGSRSRPCPGRCRTGAAPPSASSPRTSGRPASPAERDRRAPLRPPERPRRHVQPAAGPGLPTRRDGLTVKALYGRAFRAPTFRELAFDLPGGTGNPDLSLVQADELELAVAWTRNRLRARGPSVPEPRARHHRAPGPTRCPGRRRPLRTPRGCGPRGSSSWRPAASGSAIPSSRATPSRTRPTARRGSPCRACPGAC